MITIRKKPRFCCSPFPWDIALQAGGSMVGNIVGGVMGYQAQKEANKTNLQIANMNNQMSMDMFNRQLQYNSFANQRKMLEEAGYSPYSLFGTSSASAPSAPSLQQATVQPVDALAQSVGNTMGNLANVVATLAQARKTDSERKEQEIRNGVIGDLLGASLRGLMSQNEWQNIQNHIADVTKQDTIDMVGLNKLALENGLQLQTNEIVRGMINNAFLQKYGDQEHKWEIAKMQADAYKAWYEGKYYGKSWEQLPDQLKIALRQIKNQEEQTKVQQKHVQNESFANQTERMRVSSQNRVNDATVGYLTSQRTGQMLQNYLTSWYGPKKAAAEVSQLRAITQKIQAGIPLTDSEKKRVDATIPVLQQQKVNLEKQNDWYEVQQVTNLIKAMSDVSDGFTY